MGSIERLVGLEFSVYFIVSRSQFLWQDVIMDLGRWWLPFLYLKVTVKAAAYDPLETFQLQTDSQR
jgi:hypothetical protein